MLDSWNTKIPLLRARSVLWREAHQETTIAHSSCHRNTRLGAAGTGGEVSGVCWGNQGRLSRRGKGSEAG